MDIWRQVKQEFLNNNRCNLQDLANKYKVSYATLRTKKSRERWGKPKKENTTDLTTIKTIKDVKIRPQTQQSTIAQGTTTTTDTTISETDIKNIQNIADNETENIEQTLTGKQIIFCYEFVIDFNATRACICAGYSAKSARQIGSENLTKPYIVKEIRRLQNDTLKKLEINPGKIVMEHMKIAFADITSYMEIGRKEQTFYDDNGKKYKAMGDYAHLKPGILIDGSVIQEIQVTKDSTKIKLQDKWKSLDFLAKYAQLGQDYHKQMIETEKLTIMKERFKLELERNVSDDDNGNLEQLIKAIHKTDNLEMENNIFKLMDIENEDTENDKND